MSNFSRARSLGIVGWFLAVSYGIGAPLTAFAEIRDAALSVRLGLPPELIYFTCIVQLASAPAVLTRAWAPWAALALTAITIGALGSHLISESPVRAIPAAFYTALQIWFGIRTRGAQKDSPGA